MPNDRVVDVVPQEDLVITPVAGGVTGVGLVLGEGGLVVGGGWGRGVRALELILGGLIEYQMRFLVE